MKKLQKKKQKINFNGGRNPPTTGEIKMSIKYGKISSLVYFDLDRFNMTTDNRLVERISESIDDHINNINNFNFDDFIVNGVQSVSEDDYNDMEKENPHIWHLLDYGDEIFIINDYGHDMLTSRVAN